MKKSSFFILFFAISTSIFAQTSTNNTVAQNISAKLIETYRLDNKQVIKMMQIQEDKQKNLSSIEVYKKTNPTLYVKKREAVSLGANGSIKRMLNKEQLKTFRQQETLLRMARAKKTEELQGSKMSELEKKVLLIELENQL